MTVPLAIEFETNFDWIENMGCIANCFPRASPRSCFIDKARCNKCHKCWLTEKPNFNLRFKEKQNM